MLMVSLRTLGLRLPFLLVPCALLYGCEGTPPASGARAPAPAVDHWQEVYTIRVDGTSRVVEHVGYVHRRAAPGEEAAARIYDRRFEEIGFVHPSGRSYRYATHSISGEVEAEQVSVEGFEAGVLTLFGRPNQTLELRDTAAPAAAPAAAGTAAAADASAKGSR
jgi:hypothetical protein